MVFHCVIDSNDAMHYQTGLNVVMGFDCPIFVIHQPMVFDFSMVFGFVNRYENDFHCVNDSCEMLVYANEI